VRSARGRAALAAWEYRQRHHAKGVWYRVRRVLAEASHAFALSDGAVQALLAEGYQPEAVGADLEPQKTLLFVPAERLATLPEKREIPVRIGADFLFSRNIALLRFPGPLGR
jgi:hypothetical protein